MLSRDPRGLVYNNVNKTNTENVLSRNTSYSKYCLYTIFISFGEIHKGRGQTVQLSEWVSRCLTADQHIIRPYSPSHSYCSTLESLPTLQSDIDTVVWTMEFPLLSLADCPGDPMTTHQHLVTSWATCVLGYLLSWDESFSLVYRRCAEMQT